MPVTCPRSRPERACGASLCKDKGCALSQCRGLKAAANPRTDGGPGNNSPGRNWEVTEARHFTFKTGRHCVAAQLCTEFLGVYSPSNLSQWLNRLTQRAGGERRQGYEQVTCRFHDSFITILFLSSPYEEIIFRSRLFYYCKAKTYGEACLISI